MIYLVLRIVIILACCFERAAVCAEVSLFRKSYKTTI